MYKWLVGFEIKGEMGGLESYEKQVVINTVLDWSFDEISKETRQKRKKKKKSKERVLGLTYDYICATSSELCSINGKICSSTLIARNGPR